MRFAYMDSQGNEVPIPSIDALALRIELGAISADTELYDAQADRWGPAHTHDIFHTLSRNAEEEGFVAPPPAMVTPIAGLESQSAFEPPATSEPPAVESPPADSADASLDNLDLSPADSPVADAGTDTGASEPGGVGLDLAPAAADEADGKEGGFDFGDFSGLIEEELSFGT